MPHGRNPQNLAQIKIHDSTICNFVLPDDNRSLLQTDLILHALCWMKEYLLYIMERLLQYAKLPGY